MTATPKSNWRSRQTVLVLAATGAFALLTVVLVLIRPSPDEPGNPLIVDSLPPASPGVVSADYRGSRWRLTSVTNLSGTTEIPASIDAWLQLTTDGKLVAFDGINMVSGPFTVTGAGFDVGATSSSAVGYAGDDPVRWAAITGIGAMTIGSDEVPAQVTVLSADRDHLNVQASEVLAMFVRSGPARTWPMPSCCPSPS